MKTTIELSEVLMDQAKSAARSQGITLKALIESGLRMAIHPKNATANQATWPDLTFHPSADQSGSLMEPGLWREAANPHAMTRCSKHDWLGHQFPRLRPSQ